MQDYPKNQLYLICMTLFSEFLLICKIIPQILHTEDTNQLNKPETNERPGTDHVIWGHMRGLKKFNIEHMEPLHYTDI